MVYSFREGLVAVEKDGKMGYINKNGTEVIPLQYERAYNFNKGLAPVKKSGRYGYINKRGQVVIPLKYYGAYIFSEGLAAVLNHKDKWGFINKRGRVVIPFIYDGESSDYDEKGIYFNKGKVKMFKNGVEGYLNKKGVFIPIR